MATNKIDRINAEIEKTREKISEQQAHLKTCKSYSLCAPCALPLPPLPTCFPAAVFPA